MSLNYINRRVELFLELEKALRTSPKETLTDNLEAYTEIINSLLEELNTAIVVTQSLGSEEKKRAQEIMKPLESSIEFIASLISSCKEEISQELEYYKKGLSFMKEKSFLENNSQYIDVEL